MFGVFGGDDVNRRAELEARRFFHTGRGAVWRPLPSSFHCMHCPIMYLQIQHPPL